LFTGDLLFFGPTVIIYIVFIHLAMEWPKVMEKWELMECEMKQYGHTPNMAFKIKMLTCILVLLSIGTQNIRRKKMMYLLIAQSKDKIFT